MLIANNLFTSVAVFQTDTNVVTLLRKNTSQHLPKCSKEELGFKILETMKETREIHKEHSRGEIIY